MKIKNKSSIINHKKDLKINYFFKILKKKEKRKKLEFK